MIFNDGDIDPKTLEPADEKKWKLGILNLSQEEKDPDSSNKPFPQHHYEQ